jgi:hypothetical protein
MIDSFDYRNPGFANARAGLSERHLLRQFRLRARRNLILKNKLVGTFLSASQVLAVELNGFI